MANETQPIEDYHGETGYVSVAPAYQDPVTHALFVHKDLVKVRDDWDDEGHIGDPKGTLKFGDMPSWAKYVQRYADPKHVLLTWNASGIKAVLDHHAHWIGDTNDAEDQGTYPGRNQWTAEYTFKPSPEWDAWKKLCDAGAVPVKVAVEKLDDRAGDITSPAATDVLSLLRNLRATVNTQAAIEIRPDGTTKVEGAQDRSVNATIPPELTITIPVLWGHVDDTGRPILYSLPVKLRASVGDKAELALRFAIPNAYRVQETVHLELVAKAQDLLPETLEILRAAD